MPTHPFRMAKGRALQRDRSYHVQMHALEEENRVSPLSEEEMRERHKQIWNSCYGTNSLTD